MTPALSGRDFTDIFVNWTAAFGVLAYAAVLHRQSIRTGLETRTLFLLDCAGALFLVRGFYWINEANLPLGILTFVPVTLFPLACTFFVEGLLRRHVHPGLKIYVAAGTILFLVLDFAARLADDADLLLGFLIYLLSILAALTAEVMMRDRRQLSIAENRFIDTVATVAWALMPLVVSDFRKVFDWIHVPRMGGIAGLLFVYVLARPAGDTRPVRALGWEALGISARGAILAVALVVALGAESLAHFVDALAISIAAVTLTIVLERLKALQLENREASFLQWLLRADVRSSQALIASLSDLPLTEEHITLKGEDLEGYDATALSRAFDAGSAVLSLASLRHELSVHGENVLEGVEELAHILEKYDMTHVALVCHEPPTLLLLNLPPVGTHLYEVQLRLIQKYLHLLEPGPGAALPGERLRSGGEA